MRPSVLKRDFLKKSFYIPESVFYIGPGLLFNLTISVWWAGSHLGHLVLLWYPKLLKNYLVDNNPLKTRQTYD